MASPSKVLTSRSTTGTRILLAGLALACGCQPAAEQQPASPASPRPNVVVIVVDDLRFDEFGAAGHPWLETPNLDRLAREGAMFTNAFHAVPLCSPNRATLLTGLFPSQHGITDNVARNRLSHRLETFPRIMQRQGYTTAFLGKWHMGNDPTPRPGFDHWVGLPGQGRSVNPELFENGALRAVPGYATDLLTDRAVSFIERSRQGPFLLYLAHKAVHPDVEQRDDGSVTDTNPEYIPAPRHRGRYDGRTLAPGPSAVRTLGELAGKPAIRRALGQYVGDSSAADSTRAPGMDQTVIRRRAEMLLAVDESIGRLLRLLEQNGELDRTVIVVTSDNGFFFGEHGLTQERRLPYEESIRNALLIRYPPLVRAGSRPAELTLTTDLAPTILELAGLRIGDRIQGRSLVPVLRGTARNWRQAVMVEFNTYENPFPHLMDMDYRALRTSRYKYIHWVRYPEMDELYDLERDPHELRNLSREPQSERLRESLRAQLGQEVLNAMRLGR